MGNEEAVAALARVLAHETCVRLIDALAGGEATVSDLACRLHLDQPRVSTHLGMMRDAGLVDCQPSGRQRVYALRGSAPEQALATLRTLAADLGVGDSAASAPPTEDSPARLARTCYDHLAGVAGVQLMDGLLARRWVVPGAGRELRLTDAGARALARAGVGVPVARRSRRAVAIRCQDWTERRPHLGGALGAALLAAMLDQGRLRLRDAERAVDVEPGEPARFLEAAGA
ncbi:MAG TPA: metalloregulator ArsR/SmtB family transcription factor [Candidatus Eisenbacteria bacterium]|nr:metalloregulator ArsR/SmtB family transcription factor [Candidatus Eisenbacteria bacterium]